MRGEFGLPVTFWFYGGLVGFILNFIGYALIATTALISQNYIALLAVILIITVFYLAYGIIVMIGIWRAADKYEGAKIWVLLAKASVIFSAGMTFVAAAGYFM